MFGPMHKTSSAAGPETIFVKVTGEMQLIQLTGCVSLWTFLSIVRPHALWLFTFWGFLS